MKMQISVAVKLTFHGGGGGGNLSGEKKLAIRKGTIGFSSEPNTCETYGACSHGAITLHLVCIIVNTLTCC